MRKKRRRSSSARRPNAIQGKARLGQRLARAGHGRIKARHWHRRQCSGAQPMRYQRLPLAVIQHSRPACSKRNSLERLLALALGVKMVVCLGPLLVLASVIVIACYSAATNDVLNAVLPDASFTGRTDVWRFAIDHAMERPLTGFGFMAFWRTRDVFSAEMANFWANLAAHSHEYLDIALTTGLPGLAFTLLLVVVMPLINFHNRVDGNRVLSLLCLQLLRVGAVRQGQSNLVLPLERILRSSFSGAILRQAIAVSRA